LLCVHCILTDGERYYDSDLRKIYDELVHHAHRWADIGTYLGFTPGELRNIHTKPMLLMDAPKSWLAELLSEWLRWHPGDGCGSRSFTTREGLHAALLKANLSTVAARLPPGVLWL
jgi:hypothetical protein